MAEIMPLGAEGPFCAHRAERAVEASSQCPASPSSKGRRHSPGWACVIYSFPSKPGSVSSFMEHEGRKPRRQTHVQKTNTLAQQLPVGWAVGRGDRGQRRWGWGLAGEGDGGSHGCVSHISQEPCQTVARSLRPGGLLSRSIQLALWENRSSVREGQSGSQQRGGWQHGAPLPWNFLPSSAPILAVTDRALGVPLAPKGGPSWQSCYLGLAMESKGFKQLASVGNLHMICIHLHAPLRRPSVKGCEMK